MKLKLLLDKIPENSGTGTVANAAGNKAGLACAAASVLPRHTADAPRGISGNRPYRPGTAVPTHNRISMQIC